MTWLLGLICVSIGIIVGILAGLLLMYGIITKTLGKEGAKNLEDAERKHREYLESAATGHEIMERNGAAIQLIADHLGTLFAERGLMTDPDMVLLPRALTAENGAKGLLIGEFFETVHNMPCLDCLAQDKGECDKCTAKSENPYKVPVSWATIKAIYAKIVEHYGK